MLSFFISGILVIIAVCLNLSLSQEVSQSVVTQTNLNSVFHVNDLSNSTGRKIFFYLYTNKNRSHFENITTREAIHKSNLNNTLKTIFLIHGWQNDISSPMIQLVKDGYLNLSDYNIIGVDWSFGASCNYPTSAGCTTLIANWIGEFINYLIEPRNGLNISIDKINLVGHSLGAHIAGMIGEYFRLVQDCKTIPVIVGLDPAGPTFVKQNMFSRLDLHDATYVEVIHTSNTYSGIYSILSWFGFRTLGMPEAIGDVDIYPNYGGYQPLCTNGLTRFLGNCAHSQAYVYFAESLNGSKDIAPIAIECEGGYDDILQKKCSHKNGTFRYVGDPAKRSYLSKSRNNGTFGVYYFEKPYTEDVWQSTQYYMMMIIVYIVLIVIIMSIFACFYFIMKFGFKIAGYQCVRIDVESPASHDPEPERGSQEDASPLLDS